MTLLNIRSLIRVPYGEVNLCAVDSLWSNYTALVPFYGPGMLPTLHIVYF
jgi:hypothetical protein